MKFHVAGDQPHAFHFQQRVPKVGTGGGPMYRRRLGQLEAEEVPGTEGASIPFFSPDGRWLGFYSGGRLLKVPMIGGPPVPITATVDPGSTAAVFTTAP